MLFGELRHGYPLPWLIQMVALLQLLQWRVDPLNFLTDILVWSAISGVVVFAAFSVHFTKSWKGLFVVIVGGAAATVITSIFPNTVQPLFGALHYGFPYPCFTQPVPYILYPPIQVDLKSLAGDVAGWILVTGALTMAVPLTMRQGHVHEVPAPLDGG